MKRNHKRILISLIALLGLTGMYGAFHTTNVHAISDSQFIASINNMNNDIRNTSRRDDFDEWASQQPSYNDQEQEDQENTDKYFSNERPLSEIYPNGHWNGESDIKGDNTNYDKSEKDQKDLDKEINKDIRSDDKELQSDNNAIRRSDRWYANHSHTNRSIIRYVRYNSFSKRYYRPAFISDLSSYPKVGLTKSWRAVKKSAYGPSGKNAITYKSDNVIKPNQLFLAKIIRHTGKGEYIYRIKFKEHYYYYANECDKYSSEISPIAADYSYSKKYHSSSYTSFYKPWLHQIIVLNKNHKLNKHTDWEYNYDNNGDFGDYRLYKNIWHNTGTGLDAPLWL